MKTFDTMSYLVTCFPYTITMELVFRFSHHVGPCDYSVITQLSFSQSILVFPFYFITIYCVLFNIAKTRMSRQFSSLITYSLLREFMNILLKSSQNCETHVTSNPNWTCFVTICLNPLPTLSNLDLESYGLVMFIFNQPPLCIKS